MKDNITNEYGHCYYCVCNDKDCSMIYNLYVKKENRRKGYAKDLIKQSIRKIREDGYNGDIKIVAEPEENSISKKDLTTFYNNLNLKVVMKQKATIIRVTDAVFIPMED